ncbi:neutral alpha-glucosidase AB [Nephila pilipes]|uniref:Neutral alpha-glucosidase AB n=1 Tax=Nephila pilipes TaxID=299642 RepID=A0A8X6MER1_NEPPI|nr:neutral alpha-glucosidase AB [Nephila pilipes]
MATFNRHFQFLYLLILFVIHPVIECVDRSLFKTCEQSGFCKRHRATEPRQSPYYLEMSSFKIYPTRLEGVIINSQNGVMLKLDLVALQNNMLQLKASELNPIRPRYEAREALVGEPEETKKGKLLAGFNWGLQKNEMNELCIRRSSKKADLRRTN